MRDMMSVLPEGAWGEELGYSKYDYCNKETDNSRNGNSNKTLHTGYGVMDVAIPRDVNREYEPHLIKKYQNTVTQGIEENILSIYAKGMTTEETALNELELFKDKWDSKYPKIYKSRHDNRATLSTYFKYPEAVRRLIYTTNAIEGFNRQLRKVTKSKSVFPSDESLLKMPYLATMYITKKWTGHRQDRGQIYSQPEIYFEERLEGKNL